MFDQGNNFFLISLSILITFLFDNLWISLGEVTSQSLLGVKGLKMAWVQNSVGLYSKTYRVVVKHWQLAKFVG